MQFTPKSEKEVNAHDLLPAGTYPFRVISAEEKTSKSGNEMIALKLGVFHGEREQWVFDYLLESVAFKLRHFCAATGLMEKYEAGQIHACDLDAREGFVQIKIEPAKGDFQAKNVVKDYGKPVAKAGSEEEAQNRAADEEAAMRQDDDLPDM